MQESVDGKTRFDVVIVGSGAAGLTAAVVAAQQGLRVLVVEKAEVLGGTTAYSGGGLWIPNNPLMDGLGQTDSAADAETYLRTMLGNSYDPAMVDAFLASGPAMLRYMEANTEVRFYPVPLPDYKESLPGARVGRTIIATEYDGRRLGGWIRKVRTPFAGYVAFGSMQSDPQHIGKFRNAFRTLEGFRFSAGRMFSFLVDRVLYGKGAHMASGNALVGRLLRSALDAGVTIWTGTPALRTLSRDGRVCGIAVKRDGQDVEIAAQRGVVLASGGFGGNPDMIRKFMPMPDAHVSLHPESNTGDGLAMGQAAGGVMPEPNADNGIWAPISLVRDASGTVVSKYPHFGPDRGKPGSLIVGPDGRRFADEAAPYQDFVNAMVERNIGTAWFIGDHRFVRSYGMGIALPAPLPLRPHVDSGYLISAPTLPALAARIGLDPDALAATVARFNTHAAEGQDPEFGRGSTAYDNIQGDFGHAPNPNLAPVEHAPFYAVPIHPGNVSTVHGLRTTPDAEVVDGNGTAIPGLFAIGLDQNSIMRGFYPGGGASLGPGMTFAYRAALKLAQA